MRRPRSLLLRVACLLLLAAVMPSVAHAGWFSEVRVTYSEDAQLAHTNGRPMVPGPDGRLHLVYRDDKDGDDEIYYKCLQGTGWIGDRRLTYAYEGSAGACLAMDKAGNLHVAWHDFRHGAGEINWEIFYKSGDGDSWGPDERLTYDLSISTNPSLALDEAGRAYVVWHDSRNAESEVYFKMFDGSTWGEDVRLSYGSGRSDYPMLAVSPGGEVHVVWTDRRDRNKEIYYIRYDGSAWSEEVRLTDDGWVSEAPTICLDGAGTPHVVWADNRDGNHEIYYKHFVGPAWGPDTRLTVAEDASTMPCIAADDSSNLHVVWIDGREAGEGIYYKARRGSLWSEDIRLTERAEGVTKPSICADSDGNLQVVWQDGRHGGWSIYWKQRFNGTLEGPDLFGVRPVWGNTGERVPIRVEGRGFVYPSILLTRPGSTGAVAVDVVNDSDSAFTCNLLLDGVEMGTWDVVVLNADGQSDTLAGAFEVLPGLVWDDAYRLTHDESASRTGESRCIAVDPDGDVHVIWLDMRDGSREIYYRCRGESGWGMPERLTQSLGGMSCPCVVADQAGRIHVAWQATEAGGYEVYYRCRDGDLWGEPRRLNRDQGFSLYPDMATDGSGRVHVVWCDNYSGEFQILYRVWDGTSWTKKAHLTEWPGASVRPSIAVGGGDSLHLVWQNDRDGYDQIYYRRFDGVRWGKEQRVSESMSEAIDPCVALGPDGRVHVVWNDFRGTRSVYSNIYCRTKGPEGWGDEWEIPGRYRHAERPCVSADALGTVHILWQFDYGDSRGMAWARGSLKSWKHEVLVPRATDLAMLPSVVAAGDGEVHMVYCDDVSGQSEIYYRALGREPAAPPVISSIQPDEAFNADSLSAWIRGEGFQAEPEVWLENPLGETIPALDVVRKSPRLIECGFEMTAVRPGSWDLCLENRDCQCCRLDDALTVLQGPWRPAEKISDEAPSVSTGTNNARCVAMEPNGVMHAVWRQNLDGSFAIYYRAGFGGVWGTVARLAEGQGAAGSPSIVFGPQHAMHLCWNDDRTGKSEIYYRKFHGTFWGPEQGISPNDSTRSQSPAMAIDGAGNPLVFYEDRRYGPWQVICSRWDGAGWIEERVTHSEDDAYSPSCVKDAAGRVHVFWVGDGKRVHHCTWEAGAWRETSVFPNSYAYGPVCASDGLGRVMVAWTNSRFGGGKLKALAWYDDLWHDLTGIPGLGSPPSIAADEAGRFHLVYEFYGKLFYQSFKDTWSAPTRLNRGRDASAPFVAVDAPGNPVVVWTSGTGEDARIMASLWDGDPTLTGVGDPEWPETKFGIALLKPNPFRAATEIRFGLPSVSDGGVSVFDVTGRLVWSEMFERLDPGYHSVTWDGVDGRHRKVSPGVYFVRLAAGGRTAHAKVVLLR